MKKKPTIKETLKSMLRDDETCPEGKTDRQKILEKAIELICESRQEEYGPPSESFAMIANLWDVYLRGKYEASTKGDGISIVPCVQSVDVAVLNILQKVVRLIQSPDNIDTWTDIAGYAALGGECVKG